VEDHESGFVEFSIDLEREQRLGDGGRFASIASVTGIAGITGYFWGRGKMRRVGHQQKTGRSMLSGDGGLSREERLFEPQWVLLPNSRNGAEELFGGGWSMPQHDRQTAGDISIRIVVQTRFGTIQAIASEYEWQVKAAGCAQ
jgi:hypothetical protein